MLGPEQVFLQKGSCDGMGTADEPVEADRPGLEPWLHALLSGPG